jgi:hypothetical protein
MNDLLPLPSAVCTHSFIVLLAHFSIRICAKMVFRTVIHPPFFPFSATFRRTNLATSTDGREPTTTGWMDGWMAFLQPPSQLNSTSIK